MAVGSSKKAPPGFLPFAILIWLVLVAMVVLVPASKQSLAAGGNPPVVDILFPSIYKGYTIQGITTQQAVVQEAVQEVVIATEIATAVAPDCQVSPSFGENINRWCGIIMKYSSKRGIDPDLIAAVIFIESNGNPDAYSKSGAVGLMQVMPRDGLAAGFMCKNGPCFADRPSSDELFQPEFNIKFGVGYLSRLINKYGSVREALRAYGPKDYGYEYADKVLRIYNNHKD